MITLVELIQNFYSGNGNIHEINNSIVEHLINPDFFEIACQLLGESRNPHVLYFSLNSLAKLINKNWQIYKQDQRNNIITSLISFFQKCLGDQELLQYQLQAPIIRKFANLISVIISCILPCNFIDLIKRIIILNDKNVSSYDDYQKYICSLFLGVLLDEFLPNNHKNYFNSRNISFKHELSSNIDFVIELVDEFTNFIDKAILEDISLFLSSDLNDETLVQTIFGKISASHNKINNHTKYRVKTISTVCDILKPLLSLTNISIAFFQRIYALLYYFSVLSLTSLFLPNDFLDIQSLQNVTISINETLQEVFTKSNFPSSPQDVMINMHYNYKMIINSFILFSKDFQYIKRVLLCQGFVGEQTIENSNHLIKYSFINTADMLLRNRLFIQYTSLEKCQDILLKFLSFISYEYEISNFPVFLNANAVLCSYIQAIGPNDSIETFVQHFLETIFNNIAYFPTNQSILKCLKITHERDFSSQFMGRENEEDYNEDLDDGSLKYHTFISHIITNIEKLNVYKCFHSSILQLLHKRLSGNLQDFISRNEEFNSIRTLDISTDLRLLTNLILAAHSSLIKPDFIVWISQMLIEFLANLRCMLESKKSPEEHLMIEILFSQIVSTSCTFNSTDFIVILSESEETFIETESPKLYLSENDAKSLISSYLNVVGEMLILQPIQTSPFSEHVQLSCSRLIYHLLSQSKPGLLPPSSWALNETARGQEKTVNIFLTLIEITSDFERLSQYPKSVQITLLSSIIQYLLAIESKSINPKSDDPVQTMKLGIFEKLFNLLVITNLDSSTIVATPERMASVINLISNSMGTLVNSSYYGREKILEILNNSGILIKLLKNIFQSNNNSINLVIVTLKFFSIISSIFTNCQTLIKTLSSLITGLFENFPNIKSLGDESLTEIMTILLNISQNKTLIPKIAHEVLNFLLNNLLPSLSTDPSPSGYDGRLETAYSLVLTASANEPEFCQIFFQILHSVVLNGFNQMFSPKFGKFDKELLEVNLFNGIMQLVFAGLDERQTNSEVVNAILKMIDELHRIRRLLDFNEFKEFWRDKFASAILTRILFRDQSQCTDSLIKCLYTLCFEGEKVPFFEEVFLPNFLKACPQLALLGVEKQEDLLNEIMFKKRVHSNTQVEYIKNDLSCVVEFSQIIQNFATEVTFLCQLTQ